MVSQKNDKRWMRLALSHGARGLGQTWPNPNVGCVIVKNNIVLGRGFTQSGGRPHAEALALKQAGSAANEATAYVTLEPCVHTGKTPPCTNALINAGISRVVIATVDPDPRVAGKGIQALKDAGITVSLDVMKSEADQVHAGFFAKTLKNRPIVTLKLATSLDGKIATQTGDSQWITGEPSRRFVHYLRATHDAVMVGSGTVEADNPNLTVRNFGNHIRQPVRVILDSNAHINTNNNLAKSARETPVWICHSEHADFNDWSDTGAISIPCLLSPDGLNLPDVMSKLAQKGLTRVFCEGGGKLGAALIKENLVDQLIIMQAGVAIGLEGVTALGAMNTKILKDAPQFKLQQVRTIGADVISTWSNSYLN